MAAYFGSMALLLWGLLTAAHRYADPHFVVDYQTTECLVAAWLALCTVLWLQPRKCGLRLPAWHETKGLLPLALLLGVYAARWAAARSLSHPMADSADIPAYRILSTTLVVGITEEWMYRGVLMAACSAWLGLHRGAALSLALFGALHLLNAAGGQSLASVSLQCVMAALTGSVLLLAALSTRSILIPMLAHGVYDFLVFDAGRMTPMDETTTLALIALPAGPLLGLYSAYRLYRWPAGEPYPTGN